MLQPSNRTVDLTHFTRTFSKSCIMDFLIWSSLFLSFIHEQLCQDASIVLPGPQNVNVVYKPEDQRISVTWEEDQYCPSEMCFYDVEVLLTDSMKELHREAVSANQFNSKHHWSWISHLPLECASFAVRVRSRHQKNTSHWSPLQNNTGITISYPKIYPENKVVEVGSNLTFCCILGPGHHLQYMSYNNIIMNTTRISDHSYAMLVNIPTPFRNNCINVNCNSYFTGTCVYVGYPPGDRDLVCETRDLESAECHWNKGRDTKLTKNRTTQYHLNGRLCSSQNVSGCKQIVQVEQGESNWILTARNPLGTLELRDKVDLMKRVHLFAPTGVLTADVNARNASVQWRWEKSKYKILLMVCQLQLEHSGQRDMRNFSGTGLDSVVLTDLAPAQTYIVQVRCGLKQHFWRWGDWSRGSSFQTKEDIPEMLDVWMQYAGNQINILWKPLAMNQSHGQIMDYEVTWGRQKKVVHRCPVNLSDQSIIEGRRVTVTAQNSAGRSPPSAIIVPRLHQTINITMNVVGSDGGFDLVWPTAPTASCGYVVDWCPTHGECIVDWVKVPAGITRARVQSDSFKECVRYTLFIWSCTQGAPELLERREGYVKECIPKVQIQGLGAEQLNSDTVKIWWTGIPEKNHSAFINGYIISYSETSHPYTRTAVKVMADEPKTKYLTGFTNGYYIFTVKALTSLGEVGESSPVNLSITPTVDELITRIIISLCSVACLLTLATILCYRHWDCIKEAVYPEIPRPVWNPKWLTTLEKNGHQFLYIDQCRPNDIDVLGDREHFEGDFGNKQSNLTNTDSDVLAQCDNYIQLPNQASLQHSLSSFPISGTTVQNYSYDLVQQAALDMGQLGEYQPFLNMHSSPNHEHNNVMSYIRLDWEPSSRVYKSQCDMEADSLATRVQV
ncbi:hypothetical protein UPYG_G00284490 [Umbra pygmaea]|uniref:Fibronectin type-III domain-containing protein n=1 Tax=Umbra pygmaea TaxID=75934 RepID=A0ABD0W3T7_UMBPY